jgi:hypothetical protein
MRQAAVHRQPGRFDASVPPGAKAGAVPRIYRSDRVGVVKIAAVCKLIVVVLPSALDCLR